MVVREIAVLRELPLFELRSLGRRDLRVEEREDDLLADLLPELLQHGVALAQKDPLVENPGEGHAMCEEVGFTLFHAEIAPAEAAELEQGQLAQNGNLSYDHETASGADAIAAAGASSVAGAAALGTGGSTSTTTPRTVVASPQEKVGRNDPGWGGSGKKFKKCHGA